MNKFISFFIMVFFIGALAQAGEPSPVWIDVRSDDEFSGIHHPAATNIPHTEIQSRIGELKLAKNTPIHVYCRSGRRSGIAKGVLEGLGYTNVTNEGGVEKVMNTLKASGEK